MKTLRLYAAALKAIKKFAEHKEPFSAKDITEYIQLQLDMGEWELVSGVDTINHETIRHYVHEIMDNELMELKNGNFNYVKTYPTNSAGQTYKQYSVVFDSDVPNVEDEDNALGTVSIMSEDDDFDFTDDSDGRFDDATSGETDNRFNEMIVTIHKKSDGSVTVTF